jgi:hypothetical protein
LRIQKQIACGWVKSADEIPADAAPTDPDQLPGSVFCSWPKYFQDKVFQCKDCHAMGVWMAEKQRIYFEMTKASPDEIPVRCRPCRIAERERKAKARRRAGHGDP